MDDIRLGRIARVLRHRLALAQREVARRAGSSQDVVSRVERGRIEGMTIGMLRRLLAVFDAELVLYVRWRGGEVDRLIDQAHARLGEHTARVLGDLGWEVVAEVSYSEYGERGSIDILAVHPATSTLLVVEIKSELTSIEDTLRRHDAKVRLAAKVARERFGWITGGVVRLLVLPDERTPRRHVQLHAALFARVYPLRGWALRRWLAHPSDGAPSTAVGVSAALGVSPAGLVAPAGGVLFLPSNDGVRPRRRVRPPVRIRRPPDTPRGRSEAVI